MSYYMNKRLKLSFDEAITRLKARLASEGFGVLTDIDVRATMKAKLGVSFRPYRILGACNPPLAHQALEAEDKIGTMLPCNVIVQEHGPNDVEVAAIDPVNSMAAIGSPALKTLAATVRDKLSNVIAGI
jgi:uncharacterized protein (DUF302 family)